MDLTRKQSLVADARRQSDSQPPQMNMVKVAVMQCRLPNGMAPPTGIAAADAFSWDEAINWSNNESIDEGEVGKSRKFMRKIGLTTQRKKANPDAPVWRYREVPYDTWRKHYAKDAEGNYRGTHAPAQDCILKPDDVLKWRLEEPKTKADMFTRGDEVLPVYAEAQGEGSAPDYGVEGHPAPLPSGEPVAYSESAARTDSVGSRSKSTSKQGSVSQEPTGKLVADGKTAQQIIEEAKLRAAQRGTKGNWKSHLKQGAEWAVMGS